MNLLSDGSTNPEFLLLGKYVPSDQLLQACHKFVGQIHRSHCSNRVHHYSDLAPYVSFLFLYAPSRIVFVCQEPFSSLSYTYMLPLISSFLYLYAPSCARSPCCSKGPSPTTSPRCVGPPGNASIVRRATHIQAHQPPPSVSQGALARLETPAHSAPSCHFHERSLYSPDIAPI